MVKRYSINMKLYIITLNALQSFNEYDTYRSGKVFISSGLNVLIV